MVGWWVAKFDHPPIDPSLQRCVGGFEGCRIIKNGTIRRDQARLGTIGLPGLGEALA